MKLKYTSPESSLLVYYLVKLIGLAPFTFDKNRFHPPTLSGKVYPVFITTGYVLIVSVTYMPATETFFVKKYSIFVRVWSMILYLIGVPSIFFTLIIFLLMYKKIVYILNKLCILSDKLKSLGIEEDHGKYFRNLFVTVVIANSILIMICVVLILLEPHWPTLLSIKYGIDNLIGLNTVLIFVKTLSLIRQRFALLNAKLYDLIPDSSLRFPHHSWIITESKNVGEEDRLGSRPLTDLQCIRKLEALHLEFCDLVNRTTHIFASPIFLSTLRISTQFVMCSYWMYYIILNSKYSDIYSIVCTVLKMAIETVSLLMITYVSATICEQGNATRAVLFKVWIKLRPVELRNEFFMFSNQLLNTPVTVSAFGLIDLDYSFAFKRTLDNSREHLIGIFTLSVTYVIVIIQFVT